MPPFMLPRAHFDLLVAVTFDGPRYERGGLSGPWQRPSWLAQPRTSRDEIGWMLVRENVGALYSVYQLADWSDMPGAAPDWTHARDGKLTYEYTDPGYQLSALEAIKALATFETITAEWSPRYWESHARQFCASLHEALLRVVPGMYLAPSIWYRAGLHAATAHAQQTDADTA